MKYQFKNQYYAISGLSVGLFAKLLGMSMSPAIAFTPALMGIVSGIWCSVSASIIGGRINNNQTP